MPSRERDRSRPGSKEGPRICIAVLVAKSRLCYVRMAESGLFCSGSTLQLHVLRIHQTLPPAPAEGAACHTLDEEGLLPNRTSATSHIQAAFEGSTRNRPKGRYKRHGAVFSITQAVASAML